MEKSLQRIVTEILFINNNNNDKNNKENDNEIFKKCNKTFNFKVQYDDFSIEKVCVDPFKHIVFIPGKCFREHLIEVFNFWLKVPKEHIPHFKDLIFRIHNWSLLVDDIQDNSALRRSIPSAHTVFSPVSVLYSANVVWMSMYYKLQEFNHDKATTIILHAMLDALRGQALELYWRDNFICPTIREYKRMIVLKTGTFFMLGCNLLQLLSKEKVETERLIVLLTLFFQIKDDYENLTNPRYFKSKGFCEDITEGKFGYPAVHAASVNPKVGKKLTDILRQRTEDIELKKYFISLIENCGSFKHTEQLLKEIKEEVYKEIDKLGYNPHFESLFNLLDFCHA